MPDAIKMSQKFKMVEFKNNHTNKTKANEHRKESSVYPLEKFRLCYMNYSDIYKKIVFR